MSVMALFGPKRQNGRAGRAEEEDEKTKAEKSDEKRTRKDDNGDPQEEGGKKPKADSNDEPKTYADPVDPQDPYKGPFPPVFISQVFDSDEQAAQVGQVLADAGDVLLQKVCEMYEENVTRVDLNLETNSIFFKTGEKDNTDYLDSFFPAGEETTKQFSDAVDRVFDSYEKFEESVDMEFHGGKITFDCSNNPDARWHVDGAGDLDYGMPGCNLIVLLSKSIFPVFLRSAPPWRAMDHDDCVAQTLGDHQTEPLKIGRCGQALFFAESLCHRPPNREERRSGDPIRITAAGIFKTKKEKIDGRDSFPDVTREVFDRAMNYRGKKKDTLTAPP